MFLEFLAKKILNVFDKLRYTLWLLSYIIVKSNYVAVHEYLCHVIKSLINQS